MRLFLSPESPGCTGSLGLAIVSPLLSLSICDAYLKVPPRLALGFEITSDGLKLCDSHFVERVVVDKRSAARLHASYDVAARRLGGFLAVEAVLEANDRVITKRLHHLLCRSTVLLW